MGIARGAVGQMHHVRFGGAAEALHIRWSRRRDEPPQSKADNLPESVNIHNDGSSPHKVCELLDVFAGGLVWWGETPRCSGVKQ